MVGTCRDRLADAIERFGRVPIVKRTLVVRPEDFAGAGSDDSPYWASGGLVHDGARCVVLLRHAPTSRWGDAWVTPGGRLEAGETTVDGLHREVLEEVGLTLEDASLTRIFNETLTDGARVRHGYFAQFVARATSSELRPGRGVREARWFDLLPDELAFRQDYVEDFRRLRAARF
ncbi:MAG: NUDIX hydrolase [Methanobacteriota archaeon]